MWRGTGRYRGQTVELDEPIEISEGTEVEVVVRVKTVMNSDEDAEFRDLAMSRLEEAWDNPDDAVYDQWRSLYGL